MTIEELVHLVGSALEDSIERHEDLWEEITAIEPSPVEQPPGWLLINQQGDIAFRVGVIRAETQPVNPHRREQCLCDDPENQRGYRPRKEPSRPAW